jgi:hypothetical protein
MSYRINKFDGSVLTDVIDGTIDQVTTDLTLVGSDVSGYGELMNENFIHLLENFSNTESPPNPIIGQLWYDLSESLLKIYDGSSFTKVAGAILENSNTTISPKPGDIWIKSDTSQLWFHDGQNFKLAGPAYSNQQGISGFQVVTSKDTGNTDHTVVCLWCKNSLIGIISNDSFDPSSSIYNYTGHVQAGFTFINPDPVNNDFSLKLEKIILSDGGVNTTEDDDSIIRVGRSLASYPVVDFPNRPGIDGEENTDIIISTPTKINVKGSRVIQVGPPESIDDATSVRWSKIHLVRDVSGMIDVDTELVAELDLLAPLSDPDYSIKELRARILCINGANKYIKNYAVGLVNPLDSNSGLEWKVA